MTIIQFLWFLPIIWLFICVLVTIKIGNNEKSWLYKLSDDLALMITITPLSIEIIYFIYRYTTN